MVKVSLSIFDAYLVHVSQTNDLLIEMQYLGPVGYYALLLGSRQVTIEAQENFVKSTYRNRCEILGAMGLLRLSIPLASGRDHHQPYKEVRISYEEDWQRHHWKSISAAYSNSPYFEFYKDYFEAIYTNRETYLFDWNRKLMELILKLLKSNTIIKYSELYQKNTNSGLLDIRSAIHPAAEKDKTSQLVTVMPYYQVFADRNGFQPKVSVIDLLFNEGPAAKDLLVSYYKALAD